MLRFLADKTSNAAKDFFANHWLHSEPIAYLWHRNPLLWAFIAALGGVCIAPALDANLQLAMSMAVAAAAGISLYSQNRGWSIVSCISAVVAWVAFGLFLGLSQQPSCGDSLSDAATRKTDPIAVRCVIESTATWRPNPNRRSADPSSEPWRTQWDVRCVEVRDGATWTDAPANSVLSIDGRIDDLLPGDVVEVHGAYRKIYPPTNPGAFDLAEHFRHESKFVRLSADTRDQVHVLRTGLSHPGNRLRALATRAVDHSLHRWIDEEVAGLAAALVFGGREQVDWEEQQELMATGTLHLLAISGLHVEIVASAVLFFCTLTGCRNRTIFLCLVLVCVLYAGLAGGKPPVLRAVILVLALGWAKVIGRNVRLSNALSAAGLILLIWRVANVNNVGVQLSFLAVGAIGVFVLDRNPSSSRSALQAVVEESLSQRRRLLLLVVRWLFSMFRLSLWVWLVTCPIVWTNFHVVSPISIPLNIAVALPLIVSLLTGLLIATAGWFSPIGWIAGKLCEWSLSIIAWLIDIGYSIPFGHWWLPAPAVWWTIIFYCIVAVWLLLLGRSKNTVLALVLIAWIVVGVAPMCGGVRGYLGDSIANNGETGNAIRDQRPLVDSTKELRCTFLDVGHGTCVAIELPTGEVWLYDAGHLGLADRSHQEIATALWDFPTARIDTLLISHADSDHYNATRGLIERFRIGRVVSTKQFWASSDQEVGELLEGIKQHGIAREVWTAGKREVVGHVSAQVLHPHAESTWNSDNASSMCLVLEYAGKRVLLPGDLEGAGMQDLTSLPPRPCHVLMAPHHGSLTLDPAEILDWCRPDVTVVSGNHRASRPEVIEKYQPASPQLGITFRDGAVQVRIASSGDLSTWYWDGKSWAVLP